MAQPARMPSQLSGTKNLATEMIGALEQNTTMECLGLEEDREGRIAEAQGTGPQMMELQPATQEPLSDDDEDANADLAEFLGTKYPEMNSKTYAIQAKYAEKWKCQRRGLIPTPTICRCLSSHAPRRLVERPCFSQGMG